MAVATSATATGYGRDLPNLDVLRSIAVLSVVLSHLVEVSRPAVPLYRYGAFGVALFFIHTSFVLMGSLHRHRGTPGFYVRRFFRIYPLATVATLLVLLFHAPVAPFRDGQVFVYAAPSAAQLATHLLLVQNLFSGNLMLYVLWSLPLEVQMYLLLPALSRFAQRSRTLWPLLLLWCGIYAVSIRFFSPMDLNVVFSACFFLPGIMAWMESRRRLASLPAWTFPLALLLGMAAGGNARNWQQAAPVALALGLALPHFRQLRPGLLTGAAWQVARYSYGIYLVHPFCLVLAFHLLPHLPFAAQVFLFFATTAIASVAAFHLVESPGIRLGQRLARRFTAA